jgi:hypothetical protein
MSGPAERHASPAPQRALNIALLISATRCTLQYIVLPVLLPLAGLASDASIGVMLLLDAMALGSIGYSLWRLWHTRHPQRWRFAPLAALMVLVILVFLAVDLGAWGGSH